jgi:3-hydroxybutyryl-CoA dehydratase
LNATSFSAPSGVGGRRLLFDDLAVGQRASLSRTLAQGDLPFAPAGERPSFGQPVAWGLVALGLVGELIGTRLPGPGSVLLSQTSQFLAPLSGPVTASVEVIELVPSRARVRMFYECLCEGRPVLEGEAWVALERRGGRA